MRTHWHSFFSNLCTECALLKIPARGGWGYPGHHVHPLVTERWLQNASWTKKNVHPGKILATSQKITVQILEKDIEKRRLSLSYKNTLANPWTRFEENFKVNDEAEGTIKNITNYALFVSIKNSELDGMIHYKDISWVEKETDLEKYKKKTSNQI